MDQRLEVVVFIQSVWPRVHDKIILLKEGPTTKRSCPSELRVCVGDNPQLLPIQILAQYLQSGLSCRQCGRAIYAGNLIKPSYCSGDVGRQTNAYTIAHLSWQQIGFNLRNKVLNFVFSTRCFQTVLEDLHRTVGLLSFFRKKKKLSN